MKYDAFISYRHCEPDKRIAVSLHRALERYRVPRPLQKKGVPRRLDRVFRDEDELDAGDLSPRIRKALESSRFLIVVCSPQTRESSWVAKEIEHFQSLGRSDNILPVLVDGKPESAYPESLDPGEVLAADVRPLTEWKSRLRKEKLRLLARLLECSFDELYERHRRRFIRICTAAVCSAVMFLGMLGFAGYGWVEERARADALRDIENARATLQAEISEVQRNGFSELTSSELAGLADNLTELVEDFQANYGPQEFSQPEDWVIRNARATIASAKLEYRKTLKLVTEDDERQKTIDLVTVLETRATAFYGLRKWKDALTRFQRILDVQPHHMEMRHYVGNCHRNLGRLDEALATYEELVGHFYQLVDQEGQSEQEKYLAISYGSRGNVLRGLGKLNAAIQDYEKTIKIATRLEREGRREMAISLAVTYHNRGSARGEQGKLSAAIDDFDRAIEITTRLVKKETRTELEDFLATSHNNRGNALHDEGKPEVAIQDFDKAIDICTRLVRQQGRSELEDYLAMSHVGRGNSLRHLGKLNAAIQDLDLAVEMYTRLVQHEGRSELDGELAKAHNNRGLALRNQAKLGPAIQDFDKALEIRTRLVKKQGRTELAHDLAKTYNNRGLALSDQGKLESAINDYDIAIEIYTGLLEQRSELSHQLASCYSNRGASLVDQGQLNEAIDDYNKAVEIFTRLVEQQGQTQFAADLAMSHYNRGLALGKQAKLDAAIKDYDKAVRIRTRLVHEGRSELANELAKSHIVRGNALGSQRKLESAIDDYDKAIEIRTRLVEHEGRSELASELANSFIHRGIARRGQRQLRAAIQDYDKAIEIATRFQHEGGSELANALAMSHYNRGVARRFQWQLEAALRDLERSVEIRTQLVEHEERKEVTNDLVLSLIITARFYATCFEEDFRDAKKALAYAKRACTLTNRVTWFHLDVLAAAYAEAGDFEAAAEWVFKANEVAPEEYKEGLRLRLELYKSGEPYHEPPPTSVLN